MWAATRGRLSRRWPTPSCGRCGPRAARCSLSCPAPPKFGARRDCWSGRIDASTDVVPLYGALEGDEQDRAIAPAPPGRRKVVLATAIAETSITIEGVRIVVDCGPRARAPLRARCRRDAARNRARLPRRGRPAPRPRRPHRARLLLSALGRAADRGTGGFCAAGDPRRRFILLRARPRCVGRPARDILRSSIRRRGAALTEARTLLRELGAIDDDGRITDEGRKLRRLPLPPRLARMVLDARSERAARTAARDRHGDQRARPRRQRC